MAVTYSMDEVKEPLVLRADSAMGPSGGETKDVLSPVSMEKRGKSTESSFHR